MTIKFKSLKDNAAVDRYIVGTSLQGYIDISYAKLVDMLGEAAEHYDNYKSDAQWVVLFGSGQIATIYNYKDGRNYMGPDGKAKEDIRNWHIGGKTKDVLQKMSELFPKNIVS
ncbi:hypothetical protein LCGC14_1748340 [marine sediment metagenome]|uniref:Uncharacterized protein n=1 Tax=marine sediment metagenome TaxID=412755 RepID=A0A0F9H4N1_9ZZZZ